MFRIATVQMDSTPGRAKNLETMGHFSAGAAAQGAKIICFPELSITGYDLGRARELAESIPGPSSMAVSKLAIRHRITILAGLAEKDGDLFYITHLVAFPHGGWETYRKTHPGKRESRVFSPGNRLPVFRTRAPQDVCFAIGLCYDLHFPELAGALSLKGAQILFAPHASPLGKNRRMAVWNRYLGTRAYDNTLYVAACNHQKAGKGGGMGVWDFKTAKTLPPAISPGGDMEFWDLDLEAVAQAREGSKRFFLKDRRPELYKAPAQ